MPAGRPSKKDSINFEGMKLLCNRGFTDAQISKVLGICRTTVHRYRHDPKYIDTLKDNKEMSNEAVERSLFERACGYTTTETKVFCHEGEIISEEFKKHYPPDPTSMIFWLKNRKPDQWRDNVNVDLNIVDIKAALDKARKRTKKDKS